MQSVSANWPLGISTIFEKPKKSPRDIGELVPDGSSIMVGGFMGAGAPRGMLRALAHASKRNLTIISTDCGKPDDELSELIVSGSVSKLIVSYIGSNPLVQDLVLANKIEAELVPQGTLVERIRASGAGLGGVLTQTGIGTLAAESKRVLKINGTEWLLELPLRADIALLACHKADEAGNLVYRNTSQNLNPVMATAGDRVVVEARQVVPIGKIAPDQVMTPGIFVDYLVGPTN